MTYELVFVIGAGASTPLGIPDMRGFARQFEKYYETSVNRKTFGYAMRRLKKSSQIRGWDLEVLLTEIRSAKELGESAGFNYYVNKTTQFASLTQDRIYNNIDDMEKKFSIAEHELIDFIRNRCSSPDISKATEIYEPILKFSRKKRIHFITTNYDTVIEKVCSKLNYEFSDGFTPLKKHGVFSWTNNALGKSHINIYKLHGSINWFRRGNNVYKYEGIPNPEITDSIMIYPTQIKQIFDSPYLDMWYEIRQILDRVEVCIAIGHTFRDDHLKNIFKKRLDENNFKMFMICGRRSKSIRDKAFGKKSNVNPINDHFGKIDIEALLNEIM